MARPHAPTPETEEAKQHRSPASLWLAMRRILNLSRSYWGRVCVAVALTLLASSIWLAVPMGLRELLDAVFEENNRALLDRITLGLLVLFVVQAVLSFFGGYVLSWTGERVVADLRHRLYTHMHALGLRYYANQRVGDLLSRLANDVSRIQSVVTSDLVDLLRQSLTLIGSAVLMVVLNWRLSLLVLLVVPATTLATRWFGRKIRQIAREVQDLMAEATVVAEEGLSAVRVVKAFTREPHEIRRFSSAVEQLFKKSVHKVLISSAFWSSVSTLFMASLAAIFWYGGTEVLAGRLTAGDLVAFIFYGINIAGGVGGLSRLYTSFNSAVGASERLFELLDTEPEVRDAPDAVVLPRVAGSVRFEDVHFHYDMENPVLKGIDLAVEPGQTVALVGPSGAGKTTLLNLIPRFYEPQQGRILIDGHDVRCVTVRSLRDQVAVVPQETYLFSATIRENIRYGRLDATDAEIEAAARAAHAHGFIVDLPGGYDAPVGERGVKLSAGQRQRIAIARALLRDARILLLDEATSSLDAASEALVQDALERLMRGRTTFVIAHRLATVRHADRILVVAGGRIMQDGTHDQLIKHEGLYQELAALQFTNSGLTASEAA